MEKELDYEKCKKLMANRYLEFCMHLASHDDKAIVADLCSSVVAEESELYVTPVLDENLCFKYRGFKFEISSCNAIANKDQLDLIRYGKTIKDVFPNGIFSDRYVVWLQGHKDVDGFTLEQYLEMNPSETEENNSYMPRLYLVPNAWSYGAGFDCLPGEQVNSFILEAIDNFIQDVGEDNL